MDIGIAGASNPAFPTTPTCWLPEVSEDSHDAELGQQLTRELELLSSPPVKVRRSSSGSSPMWLAAVQRVKTHGVEGLSEVADTPRRKASEYGAGPSTPPDGGGAPSTTTPSSPASSERSSQSPRSTSRRYSVASAVSRSAFLRLNKAATASLEGPGLAGGVINVPTRIGIRGHRTIGGRGIQCSDITVYFYGDVKSARGADGAAPQVR